MKIFFFIVVNFLLINASKFDRNVTKPVNSDLSEAIHSVLDNIFFYLFSTANVITSVADSKDSYLQDLMTEILQHEDIYNGTYIFRLDNYTHILSIKFRLKIYNIFILDTFKSFLILNKNLQPDLFNFRGYYLFVLINGLFDEIHKMAEILFEKFIWNAYAIYEENNSVKILEFQIIRADECNAMRAIQVDTFRDGKLINGTRMFSRKKFRNFDRCPVKVVTFERCPAMCRDKVTKELYGYDYDIINELAKRMNFTLKLIFLEGEEQWGTILKNGSLTGGIAKVSAGETNVGIGNYYLRTSRLRVLDFSTPYTNDPIVMVIPPGRLYSPFEKLLQPFDLIIWILLLTSFLVGLIVILIINYKIVACRHFVFGTYVKTPILNLVSIILGNPQMKLPGRNFARYILMLFLLFCLIYRNVYQGALYIFLQSEGRHGEVQTIDEMVERDFIFYFYDSYSDFVPSDSNIYKRRKIIKNANEVPFTYGVDAELHAAFMSPLTNVLNHNRFSKYPMRVCKQEVALMSVVLFLTKNYPLKYGVDETLMILESNGMLDYWIQKYADKQKYLNAVNQDSTPRKLTVAHLVGVFNILFIGYSLAFFTFFIENVYPKIKRMRK